MLYNMNHGFDTVIEYDLVRYICQIVTLCSE